MREILRERERELTRKKKEMGTLRYGKRVSYTDIDRSIKYNNLKHDFIPRH